MPSLRTFDEADGKLLCFFQRGISLVEHVVVSPILDPEMCASKVNRLSVVQQFEMALAKLGFVACCRHLPWRTALHVV